MKLFKEKLAVLAALGICFPAAAHGQSILLEEIVVTAQLREQSLQEVPIAMTAYSEADIADAGIGNTQDFINLTPNLSLDDSFTYGNTFVSIRGVSQINNADSPVAIVVDGVPQNNQKQFKMQLVDIERIEVLKGPQGSLYGRNAIGGAINIVSKRPSDKVDGFVGVTVGNGGLFNISGAVGGTLVEDELTVRLAGTYLDCAGSIPMRQIGQLRCGLMRRLLICIGSSSLWI